MLSQTIRALEQDGLLIRRAFPRLHRLCVTPASNAEEREESVEGFNYYVSSAYAQLPVNATSTGSAVQYDFR